MLDQSNSRSVVWTDVEVLPDQACQRVGLFYSLLRRCLLLAASFLASARARRNWLTSSGRKSTRRILPKRYAHGNESGCVDSRLRTVCGVTPSSEARSAVVKYAVIVASFSNNSWKQFPMSNTNTNWIDGNRRSDAEHVGHVICQITPIHLKPHRSLVICFSN